MSGGRGEFDDNSFTLLPDEPRTLTFTPKEPIDAEAFRRSLSVTDLSKSFQNWADGRARIPAAPRIDDEGVVATHGRAGAPRTPQTDTYNTNKKEQ